jgi:D-aminopeptidase
MIDTLDSTFAAAMLINYHDKGGSSGNPLTHIINFRKINQVTSNGL